MRSAGLALGVGMLAGCVASDVVPDTDSDLPEAIDTDALAGHHLRLMVHGGGTADADTFVRFVRAARGGPVLTIGARDPQDPALGVYDPWWLGLGASAAHTLNLNSPAEADTPEVEAALAGAGAIYLRGGDLAHMLSAWRGTAVEEGLRAAAGRGVPIGGSAAGAALLGGQVVLWQGPDVESWQVLADPIGVGFATVPGWVDGLSGAIVDTDLAGRARVGRLVVALARLGQDVPLALGVDAGSSLLVWDDGTAAVAGGAAVTVVRRGEVRTLDAGAPADLRDFPLWHLPVGYTIDLGAEDPVLTRPATVLASSGSRLVAPWPATALYGDDPYAALLGDTTVSGTTDPDGWWDGALRVGPGDGRLAGLTVLPALYGDARLFGTVQAALLLALAANPGGLVLGVDVGQRVQAEGTRLTPRGRDQALVLDGRAITWAGVSEVGWRTPAFEQARLSVITGGWDAAAE